MLAKAFRSRTTLVVGIVAVAALVTAAAGWWIWRQKQQSTILFRRLPGENTLLFYVDIERLRGAAALAPLLRERVDPDPDYANFVKQTGFDYQRDLDAAAVCYLPDRVYILARGRFDQARLRQYALAQEGTCSGTALERPCQTSASRPDRRISFFLIAPDVLALATAPEPDAVLQLETTPVPSAEPLAKAAATENRPALLWATATPATLDRALFENLLLSPNVTLFSKTLAGAQRAYLFVVDQSPNLQVTMKSIFPSESQAEEMRRLLQGLNDFIGGLMRGRKATEAATLWQKVLASAVIQKEQNTVRATWTLDPAVLQAMTGKK